jgi:AraC-like DNA-binding protein
MDDILRIKSISALNKMIEIETLHPLVTIIDFSTIKKNFGEISKWSFPFYMVIMKEADCGILKYGRHYYDYQEGTLLFTAPNQILSAETEDASDDYEGWALVFHPELIRNTSLMRIMHQYTFFSYKVNEALHVTEREKKIIKDCVQKIQIELQHAVDKHSKKLIVSNIELLLNYCVRFYDRQFITRKDNNKTELIKFEEVLHDYFESDDVHNKGLPTVKYCAEKLHLSPNYFGDLVKKETGKNAQEHIQLYIIERAKDLLNDESKLVSEVAYELGFEYPQYFS